MTLAYDNRCKGHFPHFAQTSAKISSAPLQSGIAPARRARLIRPMPCFLQSFEPSPSLTTLTSNGTNAAAGVIDSTRIASPQNLVVGVAACIDMELFQSVQRRVVTALGSHQHISDINEQMFGVAA